MCVYGILYSEIIFIGGIMIFLLVTLLNLALCIDASEREAAEKKDRIENKHYSSTTVELVENKWEE